MRGRKPTPTRLKILHGNPGKRALKDDEPQPEPVAPDCPPHLDDEAKAEWARVVVELEALGLVTRLDRAALAAYCQAWSRWGKAEQKIREFGPVLVRPAAEPGGPPTFYPSPYVGIANAAMAQMRSFGSEFGMTPAARTRLHAAPAAKRDDFEDFLGERKTS